MKLLKSFSSVILLVFGCGPSPETQKSREPDVVGVESLVDSYHAGRRYYDNRTIRVVLDAHTYRTSSGQVEGRLCGPDSMVLFLMIDKEKIPNDDSHHLEIVGICRGRIRDGRIRCNDTIRIDWYVSVDSCRIVSP